ncbi:MAG: 2-C-methyl-D-erythritol 4-phosphate cytidylyltransferase [Armatimonadota bacterium]|nr:2-C-methyl-D-erythritol 4-phosphate cytidylyltransferase [Armatimonadota bacterium]
MARHKRPRVAALIAAAGRSARMGQGTPKVLLSLRQVPVIVRSILPFHHSPHVDDIVVVASQAALPRVTQLVAKYGLGKVSAVVAGGLKRQQSVALGLQALDQCDVVLVHDGARPLVTTDIIERVVQATVAHGAALAAVPVRDTAKRVDGEVVRETIDRDVLVAAQTPQGFRYELLRAAHERARADGFYGTDDAALVERLGVEVHLVPGSPENLKITSPEDLVIAEALLQWREG